MVTILVILEKLADKLQKKRPKKNIEDLEYSDLLAQEPELPDFMRLPESEDEAETEAEFEAETEAEMEAEIESEIESENEAEIEPEKIEPEAESENYDFEDDFEDDSEDSDESDVDEPHTIESNPNNYFQAGSGSELDSDSDSEIVFKVQPTTKNEE